MEDLKINFFGYGQWVISTTYYGRKVSLFTTDSQLIDNIKDGKKWAMRDAVKMIRRVNKDLM